MGTMRSGRERRRPTKDRCHKIQQKLRESGVKRADPGTVTRLAEPFLSVAALNLKSARILAKEGNYPDAVFLLQQSVEKSMKAYALCAGYLDEKTVKLIAHDGFCIFNIIQERALEHFDEMKERYDEDPTFYRIFEGYEDRLKTQTEDVRLSEKVLTRQIDLAQTRLLPEETITSMLDQLDSLPKTWTPIFSITRFFSTILSVITSFFVGVITSEKRLKSFLKMLPSETIDTYWERTSEILPEKMTFQEAALKMHRDMSQIDPAEMKSLVRKVGAFPDLCVSELNRALVEMVILQRLNTLAILLSWHVFDARYPDPERNFNPIDFYTPDLPLIIAFGRVADHAGQCIEDIRTIFDNLNKQSALETEFSNTE